MNLSFCAFSLLTNVILNVFKMAQLPVTARSYLNSGERSVPQPFFASEVMMHQGDFSKGHQVRLAPPGYQQELDSQVSMVPGGPNGTGRGSGSGNIKFDSPSPIEPAPLRKYQRARSPVPDCAGLSASSN